MRRNIQAGRGHVLLLALVAASVGLAAGPTPAGFGAICQDDRGCPSYLRCEAKRCAVPPAMTGKAQSHTPLVVFEPEDGSSRTRFYVELVEQPWEQRRGLMYRSNMAPSWGMLFLYDTTQNHRFWMKNTYIPLDLIFLGEDGRVRGIVRGARPLDLKGLAIGRPSRDVLELSAGAAKRHGIKAGTPYRYINISRSPRSRSSASPD